MIVYSILLVTFLLAIISISLLLRPFHWSRLILSLSLAIFIHLYGGWIYVSFYTKFCFDAIYLGALLILIFKKRRIYSYNITGGRKLLNFGLSGITGMLVFLYFTGVSSTPSAANLNFPFKNGNYFVLQGGNGYPTNSFHAARSAGKYAIDIVKLNKAGQRCKKVFSTHPEDYFIFGDTVYSPCAGIIERAVADNHDNDPPNRKRGIHNLNCVLIESSKYHVFLGHFKQFCVFVKQGDTVVTGQPLGLAGNSGFSLEPHLHIQVHPRSTGGKEWYNLPPAPIAFEGRRYHLFQKIEVVNSRNN